MWQTFFERNRWIFGYGLFFVFTTGFDPNTLEQTVAGQNLVAAGKRVDALMQTCGRIKSLCFVEIARLLTRGREWMSEASRLDSGA